MHNVGNEIYGVYYSAKNKIRRIGCTCMVWRWKILRIEQVLLRRWTESFLFVNAYFEGIEFFIGNSERELLVCFHCLFYLIVAVFAQRIMHILCSIVDSTTNNYLVSRQSTLRTDAGLNYLDLPDFMKFSLKFSLENRFIIL